MRTGLTNLYTQTMLTSVVPIHQYWQPGFHFFGHPTPTPTPKKLETRTAHTIHLYVAAYTP